MLVANKRINHGDRKTELKVRTCPEDEARLEYLMKKTGKSKSDIVRDALKAQYNIYYYADKYKDD